MPHGLTRNVALHTESIFYWMPLLRLAAPGVRQSETSGKGVAWIQPKLTEAIDPAPT